MSSSPMRRRSGRRAIATAVAGLLSAPLAPLGAQSWCAQPPRPGYERLERVATADDWFRVYRIDPGVFAIYEPDNYQEIISYLIVGNRESLLFDTGMGMGRISAVVRGLTTLPVTVLNSHSHFDHTGGNHEFGSILAMDLDYSRHRAMGSTHADVAEEVTPAAFCGARLFEPLDTAGYRVLPFTPTATVRDGRRIDLGGRTLEILHVPGHAPDAIALLDRAAGLLWTGDTFYEGPIWLFSPGTDLEAYQRSVERLAALAPSLRLLLPAHNFPVAAPARLGQLRDAFQRVRGGALSPARAGDGRAEYRVDGFTFLLPDAAPPRPPARDEGVAETGSGAQLGHRLRHEPLRSK